MGPSYQNERLLPGDSDPSSEDFFATAMNSLSFQEQQAVTEEVHGVGNTVIEETVERVREALKSLRENYLSSQTSNVATSSSGMNNLPNKLHQSQQNRSAKRDAYDRAVFLRPLLETDDKFHLMFLRAQRFDPFKAAQNIFCHFENKRSLFGDKLLTKKITLLDLTDHEVRLVQEGTSRMMAGREKTGRGIVYYRIGQWDLSYPLALIRSFWYILSAVEDDEDRQRKGVVMIGDWQGSFRHSPYECMSFLSRIQPISRGFTFRIESVHCVYGSGTLLAPIQKVLAAVTNDLRVRHRFHEGSELETMYCLRTFGIDLGEESTNSSKSTWSILPGASQVTTMDEYIKRRSLAEDHRREMEKLFENPSAVVAMVPNPHDILLVRSKFVTTWPGNILYHTMVAKYAPRCIDPDSLQRFDKTLITMELIHELQKDYGSRFLTRQETRWIVATDAAVQKKVTQSLRLEARSITGTHPPRRVS